MQAMHKIYIWKLQFLLLITSAPNENPAGHMVTAIANNVLQKWARLPPFFSAFFSRSFNINIYLIPASWAKFQKILKTPSFSMESP